MKKLLILLLIISTLLLCLGCGQKEKPQQVIKFAAAASLEKMFEQRLIPMYQKQNPQVKLVGTYGGSGALQLQIEQGLATDIFISASKKQMEALKAKNIIVEDRKLLKNELVLIVQKNNNTIKQLPDITKAKRPALGDFKYVPAGQYGREALEKLGLWQAVAPKTSYGSNVVEVLNWVAQGSADAGLVYATDAATNPNVKIVAAVPDTLFKVPIVYPLGLLKESVHKPAVQGFVDFLQSEPSRKVYKEYGFK